MIWNKNFDEVITIKGYYDNILCFQGNYVLPYINLGISNHDLNPSDEILYVDRSYLVILNGRIICDESERNDLNFMTSGQDGKSTFHLGGVNMKHNSTIELSFLADNAYLQTLPGSRLSKRYWLPQERNKELPNIDPVMVRKFFSHEDLPQNLEKLVGSKTNVCEPFF